MAGLVSYESSEEEEEEISEKKANSVAPPPADPKAAESLRAPKPAQKAAHTSKQPEVPTPIEGEASTVGPIQQNAVPLGPELPPIADAVIENEDSRDGPSSPYSANKTLLRDLTLPWAPNLDIPPSPPGSPPAALNKKFEQFSQLKKKGVHFNTKLEQSSALKNPSLMDKLMSFVELDEQNQYTTTLPTDLWDATGFPDWAYKDNLLKSNQKLTKEREAEKASTNRTSIEFVRSTASPRGNTYGRGEKRKGGWN